MQRLRRAALPRFHRHCASCIIEAINTLSTTKRAMRLATAFYRSQAFPDTQMKPARWKAGLCSGLLGVPTREHLIISVKNFNVCKLSKTACCFMQAGLRQTQERLGGFRKRNLAEMRELFVPEVHPSSRSIDSIQAAR